MTDRGQDYRGLHVLVDDDPRWASDPVEQARKACAGGAPVIQLRAKHATDRQVLEWAVAIRTITRASGARFVMNDRFDLALLSDADAVHLGQTDLPPSAIPAEARRRLAIGRSTHTSGELEAARGEDVDYVAFGPVFGTTSKDPGFDARGLEALARATRLAGPRPLVAIGGIRPEHLPDLLRAGVAGVAVISAVAAAKDPVAVVRRFVEAFPDDGREATGGARGFHGESDDPRYGGGPAPEAGNQGDGVP
ncbi:MAG TPA: thiamine phosphate synthase [Deltaproteobacteria bacterium]|nr:thiamine phosphate synthase [Deltaproteobacteria bacterium]